MSLAIAAVDALISFGPAFAAALPDPDPVAPPGFEAIAAILALIAVAVMFMFNSRRGEGGEHIKTFVSILIGVMIIGAATALVGFISGS
jgi:ABC-type Fe3+-siderophore transport system permease subunit